MREQQGSAMLGVRQEGRHHLQFGADSGRQLQTAKRLPSESDCSYR